MGAIGGLAVRMGQMFISGISCSADKPAKLDPKGDVIVFLPISVDGFEYLLAQEHIRYIPLSNAIAENNRMPEDSSNPLIKIMLELTTVLPSRLIPVPEMPPTTRKPPSTNFNQFMIPRPQPF